MRMPLENPPAKWMQYYKEHKMHNQQLELLFDPISVERRRWLVSPDNSQYELNKFIGNKEAVKRISRAVFSALLPDCTIA